MENHIQIIDDETILKETDGDCWAMPEIIFTQIPGYYIFTDRAIYYESEGYTEETRLSFMLPYMEINRVKPFPVNIFLPTGIDVTLKNGNHYKFGLKNRAEYIILIKNQIKALKK